MNIPEKEPTMINEPCHTQRIEFLIKELYTLQAQECVGEEKKKKKGTSYQLD